MRSSPPAPTSGRRPDPVPSAPHDGGLLERELYSEAEAARLLRVPRIALRYWLAGGRRAGRTHGPVIHRDRPGAAFLSWGEFLEAAVLACLRPAAEVDAGTFGDLLARLRDELGARRPLARARTFVDELGPVYRAQQDTDLDPALGLVDTGHDGLRLSPAAERYRRRTDWEGGTAIGWCPHDEPGSPVRVRPDRRFGRPAVNGVGTATIREHAGSGEDAATIAGTFGLDIDDVRWALAFEASRREDQA